MKMNILSRLRRMAFTAAAVAAGVVSCTSVSYAEPDYDTICKQFALVLQNAHYSRTRFSSAMYAKFLESYMQLVDPQQLYFTEEDAAMLRDKYATSFGDYLLAGRTRDFAEALH